MFLLAGWCSLRLFPNTINGNDCSDSLKSLGQIRSDARRKNSLSEWLREGRTNPLSPNGSDDGWYVFTVEMLQIAIFAKNFATGRSNSLKNWHCFLCLICRLDVSKKNRSLFEFKRHFQRKLFIGQIGRFVSIIILQKYVAQMDVLFMGERTIQVIKVPESDHKRPNGSLRGSPLPFLMQVRESW